MLLKGIIVASFAAFAAIPASAPARAEPASAGLALKLNDAGITRVDYYYSSRYHQDRHGPYYGETIFDFPGRIVGSAFGLVTSAVSGAVRGAFYGDRFYDDPYYGDRYYNEPYYRDTGDGDRYYGGDGYRYGAYDGSSYWRGSDYRSQYYGDRGAYSYSAYDASAYGRGPYNSSQYRGAYGDPYEEGGVAACEREFRSFDPSTGTYVNYDGEQVICPYLRR